MEITKVSVRKVEKEGSRMKGTASVVLDDAFLVRGIKIIEGDNGLFIAMPSKKIAVGEHIDIAHPINSTTRKMFEDAIFEAFNKSEETEPEEYEEEE